MSLPKFNLKQSNLKITQDDLQKELDKKGGKGFEPGNYDLKITEAGFHKNKDTGEITASDPSWLNVKVVFASADERTTTTWIQVPTTSVQYTSPGKKPTYFVFKKFAEFMAGIGHSVTVDNLAEVVPALFTDPSKLVGKVANVEIGYEGAHAVKQEDGSLAIARANGSLVETDDGVLTAPDFASAKILAEGLKLKLSYANIVKYTPKKVKAAPAAAPASDDGW